MISREEINNLAKLARLKLDEEEIASLQRDISNILEYVGQVSAIETNSAGPILPLHHNVMRDDVPRSDDDQLAAKEEVIRSQFPKRENNYNVVRQIIQKDE